MGICLTLVHTIYCGAPSLSGGQNLFSFPWTQVNCFLNKAVKQEDSRAGGSTIKAKDKPVQVIIQVRCSYHTLIRSLQPAVQQGDDSVGQWQQIFTHISRFTNNRMLITRRDN